MDIKIFKYVCTLVSYTVYYRVASKGTRRNSGNGYFRSLKLKQSFATKHYVFEHSCNTALVVAALNLNYNIPDSEVRCLLLMHCPDATFSSSERFAAIFLLPPTFPLYL